MNGTLALLYTGQHIAITAHIQSTAPIAASIYTVVIEPVVALFSWVNNFVSTLFEVAINAAI